MEKRRCVTLTEHLQAVALMPGVCYRAYLAGIPKQDLQLLPAVEYLLDAEAVHWMKLRDKCYGNLQPTMQVRSVIEMDPWTLNGEQLTVQA